jgi:hypothetical protein
MTKSQWFATATVAALTTAVVALYLITRWASLP